MQRRNRGGDEAASSSAVASVSVPSQRAIIISRQVPSPPNRPARDADRIGIRSSRSNKTASLPALLLLSTPHLSSSSSPGPRGSVDEAMKVLCSACEAAEARVLCCADEAALCARCDRDVHAANRLAGKHHRLPLLPPAAAPTCDICQECHAYFFCVEDRALLCRSCDVAVHSDNAFVSAHRRFLLTVVQVALQPHHQPDTAASTPALLQNQTPPPPPRPDIDWPAAGISGDLLPDWSLVDEQFSAPVQHKPAEPVVVTTKPASKRSAVAAVAYGGQGGGMPDWPLNEFFGFSEFNAGLGFTENGTSSKADSGKLGSTDGSPNGWSSSDSTAHDLFGQVPEAHHQWSVPELPSPPTASGLHWQGGGRRHDSSATAMNVPDISSPENPFRCFAADTGQPQPAPPAKRRRC